MIRATIPSPTQGVWHLGFLPIRAYALCIIAGIVVAIWLGDRRWRARGGRPGVVLDIGVWAVPFGIVGGRLYHVITSYQPYFGPGGHPVDALYIWHGGLGIWGAVALGGVGAWIGARRAGVLLPPLADVLAPGIVLAQAIGRWGNWFNNELFGGPTKLPWGLRIYEWDERAGHAVLGSDGLPKVRGIFHPTFLYESLWDLGTAGVLLLLDRRFRIGHGRLFALYVALYTAGRFWVEALRTDEANHILGLRVNLWTSVLVFAGAVAYFLISLRRNPGRESQVERTPEADGPAEVGDGADAQEQPAGAATADDAGPAPDDAGSTPDEVSPGTDDAGSTPDDAEHVPGAAGPPVDDAGSSTADVRSGPERV